ncbi:MULTISPECIES: DUF1554 domain-containing protein [Cysteiniphilum]|uniref:DUF1554 domain-containing protein n=1 Tax=Cysteiniphilum TaxID=2056696 RepID=UPI00177E9AEA|nr:MULTISPECIES: DUF1554 domain-containing protein [Cysteiniphilum]
MQYKTLIRLLPSLISTSLISACGGGGAGAPSPEPIIGSTKLNNETLLAPASSIKAEGIGINKQRLSTETTYNLMTGLNDPQQDNIKVIGAHIDPQIDGLTLKYVADKSEKSCLITNDDGSLTQTTLTANDSCVLNIETIYTGSQTLLDQELNLIIEVENIENKVLHYQGNFIKQEDIATAQSLAKASVTPITIHSDGQIDVVFKNISDNAINRVVLNIAEDDDSKWFIDLLDEATKKQLNANNQIVDDEKNILPGETGIITLQLDPIKLKTALEDETHQAQLVDNINNGHLLNIDASNIAKTNIVLAYDKRVLVSDRSNIHFTQPNSNTVTLKNTSNNPIKINHINITDDISDVNLMANVKDIAPLSDAMIMLNAQASAKGQGELIIEYEHDHGITETMTIPVSVANTNIKLSEINDNNPFEIKDQSLEVSTQITNNGNFNWYPATASTQGAYQVQRVGDENIDRSLSNATNCLTLSETGLAPQQSCEMPIMTINPDTQAGTYEFTLYAKAEGGTVYTNLDNNQRAVFSVIEREKGQVQFQAVDGKVLTELQLNNIDNKATIVVKNIGKGDLNNLSFSSDQADVLHIDNQACQETLTADQSCQIIVNTDYDANDPLYAKIKISAHNMSEESTEFPVTITKAKAYFIFTTTQNYSGNLGGIEGANNKCQLEANALGLDGEYKAMLPDTSRSVKDNINYDQTAYYLNLNNEVVAPPNTLFLGGLKNPIAKNTESYVWSGFVVYDDVYGLSSNCNNWTNDGTSNSPQYFANVANPLATDNSWAAKFDSEKHSLQLASCNTPYKLYCVQKS